MASIDFIEAKKELDKMFSSDPTSRKIVFWYDAPKNFYDDVVSTSFNNVRVLVFENNPFEIKYLINEDLTSNILLYFPIEKPKDLDNWLLDILLYSEEYYADTVALTMRRLNLNNSDLRNVIEKHIKFFDSNKRIEQLTKLIDLNNETKEYQLENGMMAVLVNSKYCNIEFILTELVFDLTSNSKYEELKKYGFEDTFWDQVHVYTNYSGEQNLNKLIKTFFMTAVSRSTQNIDFSPFYKQYIIHVGINNGSEDAEIFINKIKKDSRYTSLQFTISKELQVEDLVKLKGIEVFQECDVFEEFDKYIITTILESLSSDSISYDIFLDIISKRVNSIWYKKHNNEYDLLNNILEFMKVVDTYIPSDLQPEEYISKYTEEYYEIDALYRKVISSYKTLHNTDDKLEYLIDKVDSMYETKFLSKIGGYFTESLSRNKKEWSFAGFSSLNEFYYELQKIQYKKMFVIISDAFRYEIATELLEEIKSDPVLKGNPKITPFISPLPSETRFGMASLLPHTTIQYNDKQIIVDGVSSTGTENRDKILKKRNSSYAAISYSELNSMKRDELRAYTADKALVYVYHNVIDKEGENNEDGVLSVVDTAIKEILSLIRKLYNNLQISNFIVTADHGFIYKRRKVDESQKYSGITTLKSKETSRRFLITDDVVSIPYTQEFETYGTKVVVPSSYDVFKTQGGGMQFVHGGASLQEIVVPVIRISDLRSKGKVEASGPVGVRLKSIQRKITRRDGLVYEFEQYEKVEGKKIERLVSVYFCDEENNMVSGEYSFLANSTSNDLETRVYKIRFTLNNTSFDRNKRYFLVIKDANTNEIIDQHQFVIDILAFKPII